MDAADAVFPAELRDIAGASQCANATDLAGDLSDERENGRSDGVGRRVGRHLVKPKELR